ncbi:MAG TPA: hypothetical protein VGK67_02270 [Myxococcales bacterium]|jgi:hypothetical protein
MTRAILAALLLSLLPLVACETTGGAGSTGTQPVTAANAPDEDVYQCEEDSPTGSHMRAKNCRSRAQKKEEKRSADQTLLKPQQRPGQQ